MGQVLHGSARTTEAVRRAIQHSQESLRTLSMRHGVNPKTIAKWRKRTSVADRKTGPAPKSTVLSLEQEAVVVAFRRHTLLPLDDCLYALQATIPELTRSSLHRCLQRHDISRLPDVDGDRPRRKKFKTYPIGYFHIDIAEVRTEQGKLYLFVAIDRTAKFAFVEVHKKATQRVAADFLNALIHLVPYTIHTVLTDNVHFTTPGNRCSAAAEIKFALERRELFRAGMQPCACPQASSSLATGLLPCTTDTPGTCPHPSLRGSTARGSYVPGSPATGLPRWGRVSVAYSCLSDLADSHPQLSPRIEATSIPVGRSRQAQNTTSPSFAYLKAPHQTLHHRSTPRRLYHFFESTGSP